MQFDLESVFVCTNPQCSYTKIFSQAKEFKQHSKCIPEPCSIKDLKEIIKDPDCDSFKLNESKSFDFSNLEKFSKNI